MRSFLPFVILIAGCGVEKPRPIPAPDPVPPTAHHAEQQAEVEDVHPEQETEVPDIHADQQPALPNISLRPPEITTGRTKLTWPFGMENFLAGDHTWKGVANWKFNEDKTFTVWIEGPLDRDLDKMISIPIPAGETQLTGRWEATKSELRLTDVVTDSGNPVEPFVLDLKSVDGKFRIDIAGFRYSRLAK